MARHRLRFSKTGRAVYMSHLDLMRTFQRAFPRAGVAIRHTEGFNPHAYISVALPLSVAMESVCELLDFEIVDDTPPDTLPALLTAKMPEGIEILEAYGAERKVKEIAWIKISGTFQYDAGGLSERVIAERLGAFFAQKSIPVTKLTKKKEQTEVDIAPLMREIVFAHDGPQRVRMEAVVAAQNPGLSPSLLLEALRQRSPALWPPFAQFARVEVYDGAMAVFR